MRILNCFSMLIVLQLSCFIKFVDNQIIESHNRLKRNHEDHDVHKTNNVPLTNKNDKLHDISNLKSPNIKNHVQKPRKHKKIKAHRKRPLYKVLPGSGPKANNTSQTTNDTVGINAVAKEEASEAVLNQETIVEKPTNKIIIAEDTKCPTIDDKNKDNQREVLFESTKENMAEWQPSDHIKENERVGENSIDLDSRFVDVKDIQSSLIDFADELPMNSNNIETPPLRLNVMPLVYPDSVKLSEVKKPTDIASIRMEIKNQETNNFIIPNVENADLLQIENITSEEYSQKLNPYFGVGNEFKVNPYKNYQIFDNAPIMHSTTFIPPANYYTIDCNAPNNQYGYGNRVYYPTEVKSNIVNSISPSQISRRYRETRYPNELYDITWKKTQRLLYRHAVKKNKLKRFPKSL